MKQHSCLSNLSEEGSDFILKYGLLFLGINITIIFGGGFLIRLLRDGDFYIDQFIGGIIGIIILIIGIVKKGSMKPDDAFLK